MSVHWLLCVCLLQINLMVLRVYICFLKTILDGQLPLKQNFGWAYLIWQVQRISIQFPAALLMLPPSKLLLGSSWNLIDCICMVKPCMCMGGWVLYRDSISVTVQLSIDRVLGGWELIVVCRICLIHRLHDLHTICMWISIDRVKCMIVLMTKVAWHNVDWIKIPRGDAKVAGSPTHLITCRSLRHTSQYIPLWHDVMTNKN